MKKVTFAIMGMGNRGTAYGGKLLKYPEEAQIVAMADNRRERLDSANKYVHLPEDRLFASAEQLLQQPKLADIMIVATQDAQHRDHAIRAMELGYDLMLEKPIANRLSDITAIYNRAKELGRKVIVCHVLRYTPFYRKAKELLRDGAIGEICSIEAAEHVGYYHYAHSFVRGNWHNSEASSPMILAKCCHDMDILCWLADKHCEKLSSFGSLRYFKEENCPEGAAQRCADCTLDCPFHAQRFYLSRIPGWPSNILQPEPTEENILKTLDETDYGKCVFRMDNNVVDHQSINMQLEDEVTVTFQMLGFTNRQTRYLRVFGTEGELWGDFAERKIYVQRFNKQLQEFDLNDPKGDFSGHGGGDEGLVYDVIRVFRGDDFDTTSVTYLENSVESHYMAFAAEDSRLHGGRVTDIQEFADKA